MVKTHDPVVRFKVSILEKAMPVDSAIVFGDIWKVDGFYTKKLFEMGCKKGVLVDSLETPTWLKTRLQYPNIDFRKGDFSNTLFMKSIQEKFEMGVAYDVLLHQPPLLNTLHLMLEKVEKKFCVVQPMLREQRFPNSLVYLPGNSDELYPLDSKHHDYKMFEVSQVNQANWIWGMTPTFLQAVFYGEGFDLIYQEASSSLPNENWFWGGYIYERKRSNPAHWALTGVTHGLYTADW